MTIFNRETTSMVMRYILATLLITFNFLSAHGQSIDPALIATAASVGGNYTCMSECTDCENTLTKLNLTADANSDGGTFTIKRVNMYDDGTRRITYKYTGEWYVLPNRSKNVADNTTIIVADIDDFAETWALFLLKKDGNLLELNRKNPEKMPLYVYADTTEFGKKEVYIARKAAQPLPLARTLYYRYDAHKFLDATFEHVFKKD